MRKLALGIVAALLVTAGVGYWLLHDRPSGNLAHVEVVVPTGVGVDGLVDAIAAAGLAPHPWLLRWVLKIDGTLDGLQAGAYSFPGDAHALEVVTGLGRAPYRVAGVPVTLIPGESQWEALARLKRQGLRGVDDVATHAADQSWVQALRVPVGPPRGVRRDGVAQSYLDGFLYPETYHLTPGAAAEEAVERAVAEFRRVWGELIERHAASLQALQAAYGVSEREVIVLASLIEEEVRVPGEAARVAGVFYNRLAAGMRLQTDPTLMYHPERVGKVPGPADRRNRDNPYNTYAYDGLPPGPICSPGRRALEAALAPERHDLLYFVAMRDGSGRHAFAKTLAEHGALVREHLKNR